MRAVALALASLAALTQSAAGPEPVDLLLRGGRVLDGSGNPWFAADVAVRGDRVVAVGQLEGMAAHRTLDVSGLIVAPGFIDTHVHASAGLSTAELSGAEPLLAQGITTVFANVDGAGAIDLTAQRDALLRHGIGINVAQLVPHGSLRAQVVGMDDRVATDAELEAMREAVRAGMQAGALGLSSGTFYAPGSFAPPEELVALAEVAARHGGAYQSHIRDEADFSVGLLAAIDEVIDVGRRARLPVVITHVKALGPSLWGRSVDVIARIEAARAEGIEVWTDQYPYTASSTGLSAALLPRWAEEGGVEARRARLSDDALLPRIREAIEANLARRGGADRILLLEVPFEPELAGWSLASIAAERGEAPADVVIDLLRRGSPDIASLSMDEADVRALMQQPWTMTASDGSLDPFGVGKTHPRSLGTFPRKLGHYALRERVVTLETAVRSMTSLPALVYRIADRGTLRPGAYADLVAFSTETIADRATFEDPWQLSQGVVHLLVNGTPAVLDGERTGAMAGRVLRR